MITQENREKYTGEIKLSFKFKCFPPDALYCGHAHVWIIEAHIYTMPDTIKQKIFLTKSNLITESLPQQ